MLCMVCGTEGAVACAECSNGCTVAAHEACFSKRRASPAWRKKHGTRGNREAEVCPHAGCAGRIKLRVRAKDKASCEEELPVVAAAEGGEWCLHADRHGLPCNRRVKAHGACAVHLRTMLRRRAIGARLLASALTADDRTDAQTQTEPVQASV